MNVMSRLQYCNHHGELSELLRREATGTLADWLVLSIMHGNGNVIMVVDEGLSRLTGADVGGDLAKELCGCFHSVRIDGVAFLRTADGVVRMTYFERDGTHSQMCGNALRCVARYATEQGYLLPDGDMVTTDDGPKYVSTAGGEARVAVGPGREFQQVARDRYFVFSGLPHLVLLLDDTDQLDAVDVKGTGAALRWDDRLCRQMNHPEGLHVDFMQRHGGGIRVRTYEVGVEDETQACGTGVAGSAFVAHRVWGTPFPIKVGVRGGEMRVDDGAFGLVISGTTQYLLRPEVRI